MNQFPNTPVDVTFGKIHITQVAEPASVADPISAFSLMTLMGVGLMSKKRSLLKK